jgi:hypothetical protein
MFSGGYHAPVILGSMLYPFPVSRRRQLRSSTSRKNVKIRGSDYSLPVKLLFVYGGK